MSSISLSPTELLNQADQMFTLMSSYDSLFMEVRHILHTVNDNWSENLANNFEGKIASSCRCCEVVMDVLQFGGDAARKSAEQFQQIDTVLAAALSEHGSF